MCVYTHFVKVLRTVVSLLDVDRGISESLRDGGCCVLDNCRDLSGQSSGLGEPRDSVFQAGLSDQQALWSFLLRRESPHC